MLAIVKGMLIGACVIPMAAVYGFACLGLFIFDPLAFPSLSILHALLVIGVMTGAAIGYVIALLIIRHFS